MTKLKTVPHQLTEHTKLLQKAVLVSNNKALVLKRSNEASSRPGKWDLPGGNSEWPQTEDSSGGLYQKDLIREVEEETGIILDESVFDPNYLIYFDTYFEAEKQLYSIIANWWIELPEKFDANKIEISDEHTKYEWITIDELDLFDFGGDKGAFVKKSIETALAYSSTLNEETTAHEHAHSYEGGCCGGTGECKCKH